MNKDWIFPITYGRSGSTLLMGLLNSNPGFKIAGENHNAMKNLWTFYLEMIYAKNANDNMEKKFDVYGTLNPWWNDFKIADLRKSIRRMMATIIDPNDEFNCVGYKEIRYTSMDEDLYDYLTFMYHVFRPKFIFFTRNLDDVCVSKWHARNPIQCQKKLSEFEDRIRMYMNMHNNQNWFWLTYEDVVERRMHRIDDFYHFLNVEFNETVFESVLDIKHGY